MLLIRESDFLKHYVHIVNYFTFTIYFCYFIIFIILIICIVNWFRREYGRSDSLESHDGSDSPVEGGLIHQAASLHHSYSKSSQKSTGR